MDVMRIFKTAATFLLVAVFLLLLISAYSRHREISSACSLVEASSSIANHLVLEELRPPSGGRSHVVDPARVGELPCRISIGGENFVYRLRLTFWRGGKEVTVMCGPEAQANAQTSSVSLPVTVFDNFRMEAGLMEVVVWRE